MPKKLPPLPKSSTSKKTIKSTIRKNKSNSDLISGVFSKLQDSNKTAHLKAIQNNNQGSNFENIVLKKLGHIDDNTKLIADGLTEKKKGSGLLGGLLGTLGTLFNPFKKGGIIAKGLLGVGSVLTFLKSSKFFKPLTTILSKLGVGKLLKVLGGAGIGKIGKKGLALGAAKMAGKAAPGLGLVLGAGFAAKRVMNGDYLGALGEAVSGLASTVPGIGTGVSLAIQGGLAVRDISRNTEKGVEANINALNNHTSSVNSQQLSMFESVSGGLKDIVKNITVGITGVLTKVGDMSKNFITSIFSWFEHGFKRIGEMFDGRLGTIVDIVKGAVTFALNPLNAIINKIKSIVPNLPSSVQDASNYVSDKFSNAGNYVADKFNQAKDWVYSKPSGKKPSMKKHAERNFNKYKGYISEGANKFGVDAADLAKVAFFESGGSFSPTAAPVASGKRKHLNTVWNHGAGKKAISSAYGLGQFTISTWHGTLKKHWKSLGFRSKPSEKQRIQALKDPRMQALALAALTKDHTNATIRGGFSSGSKMVDVYAMHNLGAGGGPKFLRALKANPNAKVSSVLSRDVIKRNTGLYSDGNISLKQASINMQKHMDRGEYFARQMPYSGKSSGTRFSSSVRQASVNSTNHMSGTPKVQSAKSVPNFGKALTDSMGDKVAATAEKMSMNDADGAIGMCLRGVFNILGQAGIPGFPKPKTMSLTKSNMNPAGLTNARDAGSFLLKRGFKEISASEPFRNGDVDVLGPRVRGTYQGRKLNKHGKDTRGVLHPGHIQVYANGKWYSDGKQPRRYTTQSGSPKPTLVYSWIKRYRYKDAGSISGDSNSSSGTLQPPQSSGGFIDSVKEKAPQTFANALNSVFTSDKLDGLRDLWNAKETKGTNNPADNYSFNTNFKAPVEYAKRNFGRGPNLNGVRTEALNNILNDNNTSRHTSDTSILNTSGFRINNDRQTINSTIRNSILNSTGFSMNNDRQKADIRGILNSTGFKGINSRHTSRGSSILGKSGWLSKLLGSEYFPLLSSLFPNLSSILKSISGGNLSGILSLFNIGLPDGMVDGILNGDDPLKILNSSGILNNTKLKGILKPSDLDNPTDALKRIGLSKATEALKSNSVTPSNSSMQDWLSSAVQTQFENNRKMSDSSSLATILQPPKQSVTNSKGGGDGATLPISVRNNDSLIKEIAKEYLKNSI